MGCSFVAAGINLKENVIILSALAKGWPSGNGIKKIIYMKWTQCKLRIEGDASSADDRKTILWTS